MMRRLQRWKAVPEWEGVYKVSDNGVVWNVRKDREVKGTLNNGYRRVCLSDRGRVELWLVHRLVLTAFVGPCPKGMEACHNDGERNARLSNLRWDTRSANLSDRSRHNPLKDACVHGHEFSEANTYYRPNGHRDCRKCLATRARERRNGNR